LLLSGCLGTVPFDGGGGFIIFRTELRANSTTPADTPPRTAVDAKKREDGSSEAGWN